MSLLPWLKPPVKHSHIENSDSEEEEEPEEEEDEPAVTSDVIPDLTSDSSTCGTSTTSSRPSCSKQS